MTVKVDEEVWVMQPEQNDEVLDAALIKSVFLPLPPENRTDHLPSRRFCDVDGLGGKGVLAIPAHVMKGPFVNPALMRKFDHMSVQDRVDEVRANGILSEFELKCLAPWMSRKFGANLDKCSFLGLSLLFRLSSSNRADSFFFAELIRWALNGGGVSSKLGEMTGKFKVCLHPSSARLEHF